MKTISIYVDIDAIIKLFKAIEAISENIPCFINIIEEDSAKLLTVQCEQKHYAFVENMLASIV